LLYVPPSLTFKIFTVFPQSTFVYCVVLTVKTYCFALQNQLIGFRNRGELRWLCGANRIFKCRIKSGHSTPRLTDRQ